jgi:3-hydroxyisobutyrate dehydrogenase
MSQAAIGFIGTGVMGASMAGHLLNAGHPLYVYNRTRDRARTLLEAGATWCDTPEQVARQSALIITMVGMPSDVESLYLGARGLISQSQPGALLIDMTTSDPELAARIARTGAEKQIGVIDAPVSGGDIGARNATLSIMVGADAPDYERALPVFKLLGKTIVHQGPPGAGQYTKLCNQVAIAATMLSVSESMALAIAAGLDPTRVLESITSGAANSWPLSQLMPRALKGDYAPGFAVRHLVKDLRIALECAERLGLELHGLALARRLYEQLLAQGDGDKGTQVLLREYVNARRPSAG